MHTNSITQRTLGTHRESRSMAFSGAALVRKAILFHRWLHHSSKPVRTTRCKLCTSGIRCWIYRFRVAGRCACRGTCIIYTRYCSSASSSRSLQSVGLLSCRADSSKRERMPNYLTTGCDTSNSCGNQEQTIAHLYFWLTPIHLRTATIDMNLPRVFCGVL